MTRYLADLNPQQRMAVEHGIKKGKAKRAKPLLVIAGAGTGKTKTLTHRVAHLIVNGVHPDRILLLTFSRRAAQEMTQRAQGIVAKALNRQVQLPWSGTFHAMGARLLREYGRRIGLEPSFTIHDRGDSADLMDIVRHDLRYSKTETRFPRKDACLAIYSLAVNSQARLSRVLKAHFPWCIEWKRELRALFAAYAQAKRSQNVLDYDDLLLYWAEMLNGPELAAEIGDRFDQVPVDEYQDTNRLQGQILRRLKPDGRGLMVVGDDAQEIYSFRAATVRNILDFPNQFDPLARVITLEQNYRSTQPILDACNKVMELAAERFTKNLRSERQSKHKPTLTTVVDEAAQARHVAQRILKAREAGVALKSQAVLFRASNHSAQLEIELGRRNIPFVKFGGLKFIEASHIKDLLAVLRWAENPRDRVAGFRALQLLPGIGPSSASRLFDRIASRAVSKQRMARISVPKKAAAGWPGFAKLLVRLGKGKSGWPAEFALVRRWYEPVLEQLYDDASLRVDGLAQLEQIAAGFSSRRQFLTELTLDPPEATTGPGKPSVADEEYLVLSTIHSAKGQEWKNVTILSAVEGAIPSPMASRTPEQIEEERRLLHVAMTRTKDDLDLVLPQRFYSYRQSQDDQHVYGSISRFLPRSVRGAFEARASSQPRGKEKSAVTSRGVAVDVPSAVGRRWR